MPAPPGRVRVLAGLIGMLVAAGLILAVAGYQAAKGIDTLRQTHRAGHYEATLTITGHHAVCTSHGRCTYTVRGTYREQGSGAVRSATVEPGYTGGLPAGSVEVLVSANHPGTVGQLGGSPTRDFVFAGAFVLLAGFLTWLAISAFRRTASSRAGQHDRAPTDGRS